MDLTDTVQLSLVLTITVSTKMHLAAAIRINDYHL